MRRGPHATGALGAVVRAGVGRRRVQSTVMVLTTLIAVTASVVAAGVLVASRAPFDQAMAEQRGAHLTAWFDPSKATEAQLAATARASGVADAAGPFRTVSLSPRTASASGEMPSGTDLPELTVAGRADAGGPVDRLDLVSGRWATRPGEIVLAEGDSALRTGTRLDFPGLKGTPTLTVVGIARSVTGTADAWVTPAQAKALTTPNGTSGYAMLYRLSSADTDAQVAAGRAAIDAAAPEGALTGTRSHLAVRQEQLANALAFVPFVAAFGVLALAMSVLIIGIVVSGAVGAATRRIGILKSLGFTPAQVVRAYVAQALLPAAIGCALGVALGNLLAGPVLGSVEDVYRGARATIPWWIDVTAPAVALALVAAAAFVPALRAGRLRTVEALTVGRTAETGRGRGPTGPAKGRTPGRLTGRLPLPRLLGRTPTPATGRPAGRTPHPPRRLAGRLPLPQPVTLGLAHPLSRPARSATTAAAVALATVTVTFAVGLALTLGAVQAQRMLDAAAPVVVETGRGQGGPAGAAVVPAPGQQPRPQADPADVTAALKAEQRTRRYYSTAQGEVRASGITGRTAVVGYDGDASWAAPELVSGSWLSGPGQAVVTERFLDAAGVRVGDSLTLTEKGRSTTVRIVGEAFFTEDDGMLLLTQATTLTALGLDADPHRFYAQPDPGTATSAYLTALNDTLADTGAFAHTNTDNASSVIAAMDALIAMLTLMLVAVAGLGVLNTVVLDTRDRIHDLGTLKALGMTPRQTVGMVLTSVTGIGLLAAAAGVPLGIALHHYVTPLMGDAVGMNLPDAFLTVYAPLPLTLLALGGVSIAVGGALLPAGWAARTDTAKALRTE
ncbi:FtsX-like permease family protein [Streptomyces sp. NBC_00287]|uniref:ABC transporter permease n=1 Tax=Streptomyces sp. NBC_00287 TaxID=2975702 RepID=UPI002E2A3CBB|nr:FtsX-like permease family protein [Streptomyces sp. NBC_00287]